MKRSLFLLLTLTLAACAALAPEPDYDFVESGKLVRNLPGLTPGMWYLLYEEEGNPEFTARLTFDENTACVQEDGKRAPCQRSDYENNLHVTVSGMRDSEGVQVMKMEMAESQ